jgi:hypothetical protein
VEIKEEVFTSGVHFLVLVRADCNPSRAVPGFKIDRNQQVQCQCQQLGAGGSIYLLPTNLMFVLDFFSPTQGKINH